MKRTVFILSALVCVTVVVFLQGAAYAQEIPTWSGSYSDTHKGSTYGFTMVGGDPSNTGSTTIPVYLIPVPMNFDATTCKSGNHVFDPSHLLANGETVTQNTISSPIFQPIYFSQVGSSAQYVDAFQRTNFWGVVQNNPNYHLLLPENPTVVPAPYTLVVPSNNPDAGKASDYALFGGCVGAVDPAWLEGQLLIMLTSLPQVHPNGLALFLVFDVYIGFFPDFTPAGAGHHGYIQRPTGRQTLAYATYSDGQCFDSHGGPVPCPWQDVADFAHEVGEWADNPYDNNPATCDGGEVEVGDPLIGQVYPYTGVNNFGYNLQDLVFLPWFGAPSTTSLNGYLSFQNEALSYCKFHGQ